MKNYMIFLLSKPGESSSSPVKKTMGIKAIWSKKISLHRCLLKGIEQEVGRDILQCPIGQMNFQQNEHMKRNYIVRGMSKLCR